MKVFLGELKTCSTESDENHVRIQQRGRKRKRDENNWARNVRKRHKNAGQVYTDKKGSTRPAKLLKKGCRESCRFKCQTKFSSQDRKKIFHSYWKLGDITRQRDVISRFCHVQKKKVHTVDTKSRRSNTFIWSLPLDNCSAQRVCKTFFLQTLGISDRSVSTALEKVRTDIGM